MWIGGLGYSRVQIPVDSDVGQIKCKYCCSNNLELAKKHFFEALVFLSLYLKHVKLETLLIVHKKVHDEPLENLAVYEECKGNELADRASPYEWPNYVGVRVVLALIPLSVNLHKDHYYLKRFEKQVNHDNVVWVHTKLRQADRI